MQRARAKVFINGGSQAVRLPKQFRVETGEVEIWRDGKDLRIRPVDKNDSWDKMFAEIDALTGGEWPDREQPNEFERVIALNDDDDEPNGGGKS